jgi:predicted nuclease of restriction endonuclease-like (RecB) superfamily
MQQLLTNLFTLIEKEKSEHVRRLNASRFWFYWDMGNYIRKHPEASVFLKEKYGNIFHEKNLRAMRKIAKAMPDRTDAGMLVQLVGLAHMLVLLPVEKKEARLFYAWLAAARGLTANELKKIIKENIFEQAVSVKGRQLKKLIGLPLKEVNAKELHRMAVQCIGSGNITAIDDPLQDADYLSFLSNIDGASTDREEITGRISELQRIQHSQINHSLNFFFWQIGDQLKTSSPEDIDIIAKELTTKYGSNFEVDNLKSMLSYAEQFPDPHTSELTLLVSWPHILLLLPLQNMAAQHFYARLSAIRNLSPEELQMKIRENVFELSVKTGEPALAFTEVKVERTVKKERNTTFEMTSITLPVAFNADCNNVFRNPWFLRFQQYV